MRSARSLLVATAVAVTAALAPALPAHADKISDMQAQAVRLQDRVEALGNQAEALGEQYNDAVVQLDQAKKDTDAAQVALDRIEGQLGDARSQVSTFALRAYVYADATNGLTAMMTGDSLVNGAAQREGYSALALGVNKDATGDLRAKVQDADYQRAVLRKSQAKQETLTKVVAQRKTDVEKAQQDATDLLANVKGELAVLVQQEAERRAAAAAAASRAAAAAAEAALAAQAQSSARLTAAATPAAGNSRPPATPAATKSAVATKAAVATPAAPAAPSSSGRSVPPPSRGASGAIAAAMSQLGVSYRFAAESPGVAFDCSGLVAWAWGQAGVSLPHSSAAMAAMLPHISLSEAQPGDLVFFYSPVHHVGIYLGGGMMIHAPNSGSVVSVSAVGRNLTSVGRVTG